MEKELLTSQRRNSNDGPNTTADGRLEKKSSQNQAIVNETKEFQIDSDGQTRESQKVTENEKVEL